MTMLLTKAISRRLVQNGQRPDQDHKPVCKLFTPDGSATWLLSEADPAQPNRLFGLADLGLGSPELGYIDLIEIAELRGRLGLPVERDRFFVGDKPISHYLEEARRAGRIIA